MLGNEPMGSLRSMNSPMLSFNGPTAASFTLNAGC